MTRILAAVFGLVSALSCVAPDRIPTFTPALEAFDPQQPDWLVTRPVSLMADCQLHNIYMEAIPERNLSAEAVSETAIRPPQLDLFADDVLRWILQDGTEETEAILHLGDAADIGCEGEMLRFLDIMNTGGKPWLMTPGNHECYYFGVYQPRRRELWEGACRGSGGALLKDEFVRLYVAGILGQEEPSFEELAESLGLAEDRHLDPTLLKERIPDRHRWEAREATRGFLSAIAWNIDSTHPWRSFVVQMANLDGPEPGGLSARAVLLDSCQYWERPAVVPNAWQSWPFRLNVGFTGEILPDQLRIVRDWASAPRPGTRIFLPMGHHPFQTIAARSRASLRWLWQERKLSGVYVSAHTHQGFYEYHFFGKDAEGRPREALELNIGSTTDWPMEWRTFQAFGRETDDVPDLYLRSQRFTLLDVLRNRKGYFERDWEVPVDARDDYRQYRTGTASLGTMIDLYLEFHLTPPIFSPQTRAPRAAIQTEESVKNATLWTYARLFQTFPTAVSGKEVAWPRGCVDDGQVLEKIEQVALGIDSDDKVELLMELGAFEQSRDSQDPVTGKVNNDARRRYKVCQAIWASRFEFTGGRVLQPEDDLVRVRLKGTE